MKTDAEIKNEVELELKWDPSVTQEHIGVAVTDAIVTLSGAVPSFIEKQAAERAAQRVGGVRAVVEKIDVRVPGSFHRDDEDIAGAIIDQLRWNVQVPDDAIKVRVENGWVDLTGDVEWEYQRRAAEDSIRRLTGVVGITNKIDILPKVAKSQEIQSKIEAALKRAAEREAAHLGIQVRGNRVILSGKVRSFAELRAVKGAAWSAPGVTSVDDTSVIVSVA